MSQFLGNMSTPNVLFDVARGNLEGASAVNLFGFNKLVGSEFEIIWNDGGQYIYPVAAVAMTVTTDNVDDYGKQVQIQGLDANYDMLSEVVTLSDGGVVTNSLFFRINLAIMVTDENIGNVIWRIEVRCLMGQALNRRTLRTFRAYAIDHDRSAMGFL